MPPLYGTGDLSATDLSFTIFSRNSSINLNLQGNLFFLSVNLKKNLSNWLQRFLELRECVRAGDDQWRIQRNGVLA